MDSFQLPLNQSSHFYWPNGVQIPQSREQFRVQREKRKLEPDANEVVERLNGFNLSPNSLKKLRTSQAADVSTAPGLLGSSLPQQQFESPALEIEVDPAPNADDSQRPFMVQLPSPSSPDGSPPRGTQGAIIPYPSGFLLPQSACQSAIPGGKGNSGNLMQALDLKGRGGAEASAPLDIPRRLVRNSSCSSLPRFLAFNIPLANTGGEADMEEDPDPNSKAVIPWAPPPLVLQGVLGALRSGGEQPMEEEMEDAGSLS